MKIVVGIGYADLSMTILLFQHHEVTVVDIVPEKIDKIPRHIFPMQDGKCPKMTY